MSNGLIKAVVVSPPKIADVHWIPRCENHEGKILWSLSVKSKNVFVFKEFPMDLE